LKILAIFKNTVSRPKTYNRLLYVFKIELMQHDMSTTHRIRAVAPTFTIYDIYTCSMFHRVEPLGSFIV